MAKFNSKFKYMYDAAAPSALIVKDGVAHTASFNGNTIIMPAVQGWWNQPQYPADYAFAVAVNVDALDFTTGDETYTVELEWGTKTGDFTNSIKTHKAVLKATGQIAFLVDMDTVLALKPDAFSVRLAMTLAGTTPIATLYGWLAGQIIDAN